MRGLLVIEPLYHQIVAGHKTPQRGDFQREVAYGRKRHNTSNDRGVSHDFPDRHFIPADDEEDDMFGDNYGRWDIDDWEQIH